MRKSEFSKLVSVAGGALLTFLFLFSQCAWAGQDERTRAEVNSTPTVSAQQAQEKQAFVPSATAQSEAVRSTAEENSVSEKKPSGDGSMRASRSTATGQSRCAIQTAHWSLTGNSRTPIETLATSCQTSSTVTLLLVVGL
jgi:hypothetical protein